MATKKRKKATTKKKKEGQWLLNVFGLIFFACGLMALFQLGFVGILFANVFRFFVGNTFPVATILFSAYGLYLMIFGRDPSFKNKRVVGVIILYATLILFFHALLFASKAPVEHVVSKTWGWVLEDIKINGVRENLGGGMLGAFLYAGSHFLFAQIGTYFVSFILLIVSLLCIFDVPMSSVTQFLKNIGQKFVLWVKNLFAKSKERPAKEKTKPQPKNAPPQPNNQVKPLTPGQALAKTEKEVVPDAAPEQLSLQIESYQKNVAKQAKPVKESVAQSDEEFDLDGTEAVEDRDYQLPPSTLLQAIPVVDQSDEYHLIEQNVEKLEKTFKSFGVDAKVIRASLGPSVTKYEVQPAVGVKVSKIVNLSDDLALALAAKDIRIEAPIPGKSFIGIEVPNSHVSTVSFRDIVEAQPSHPDHLLEVPLGRNISGDIVTCDLAKMPHLLIAGSTGSGKSVCVNGIITSILMHAKPHEVKLMLIDPKKVELNVYNGIPHLLTPVVTNPRKAAQALQKVVAQMEERYEKFAATGTRNIEGYNKLMTEQNMEKGENHPVLPYIVVVVDELADLMMVASNEVEDAIIRLAQMARAAGIHMILATQRPSVDVITGLIKANVPSRIAFAVSSGVDSRTIIDSNGAEKLLGRGDMLYLPMGENKPERVQGAFISDSDVEKIVTFVQEQQEADYQEDMMPSEIEVNEAGQSSTDELFDDAVAFVVMKESASVSMLQRRFHVGYNRAGRLIDEMEERGIVGPSEGSKARKVLMPKSMLETDEPPETY